MSNLEQLAEAAKALSAPVTKFIEVCAAGMGRLYGPTDIRRTARAHGDAMVIIEEATGRASETAIRAAQRLLEVEEQRQKNLEAIASLAYSELPASVAEEPVKPDWIARFFREARDVSDTDMRFLWAKMLAGEVARPSSFSPRTLRVVSDLTVDEARTFEILCRMRMIRLDGAPYLFHTGFREHFDKAGVSSSAMFSLQDAGLVTYESAGWLLSLKEPTGFEAADETIFILSPQDGDRNLRMGTVAFTPAGRELAALVPQQWHAEHYRHISSEWSQQGFSIETGRIVTRRPDGKVDYEPIASPL
jgi:hypothetical protein